MEEIKNVNEPQYDYDENNNLIHTKNSDGFEKWLDYDKNNNLIHYKDSTGDEYWYTYDEKSNIVHVKCSDGVENWYECDEKGNLIYIKIPQVMNFGLIMMKMVMKFHTKNPNKFKQMKL